MQQLVTFITTSITAVWIMASSVFSRGQTLRSQPNPTPVVIEQSREMTASSASAEAETVALVTPSPQAVTLMPSVKPIATTMYSDAPFHVVMKDVGEAYMDYFGLSRQDFEQLKNLGVTSIEGNFDSCATKEDVQFFLDESMRVGIGVIMPAGSGEAEWGFACDQESYPDDQRPVWQKAAVQSWIATWKHHPAVVAWDISNEAGTTFPNASEDKKEKVLSLSQLQQAYNDVRRADASRPVLLRMMGWYFYDQDKDFYSLGNPFGIGVADIVMINAYSNVEEYFPDFVSTVTSRALSSIGKIDPKVRLIIALGAWKEDPMWKLPPATRLAKEINTVYEYQHVLGIAFFKYGAKGSEWYLPLDAPQLLLPISR